MKPTPTKKTKPVRHIATRNGVPCSLDTLDCRAAGFRFCGRVLFPLPLPPSDPYVFGNQKSAMRAVERTERLSRKVRQSIIRDFVVQRIPSLQPFAIEAVYKIKRFKK